MGAGRQTAAVARRQGAAVGTSHLHAAEAACVVRIDALMHGLCNIMHATSCRTVYAQAFAAHMHLLGIQFNY
jgi:hypothetical protein